MGEDLLTQVGSYERWTRVCERLREIMSVCECLRVLGGLSGAGFAGFIGIFRIGEDLLTQVGSYERWTRVCEHLREIMSVSVCWVDCLEQDLWDLLGFSGWREDLLVRRWAGTSVGREIASVYERSREFASVYECWADCLEQDLQDFLGFSGWRGSRRHWCAGTSVGREIASVYERSRAFACVYECWADCLKQDLWDFLGFSGWGRTC